MYGLNPGLNQTDIREYMLGKGWLFHVVESMVGLFCKSAEQYAESVLVPLMVAPELQHLIKLLNAMELIKKESLFRQSRTSSFY